MHETHLMEDHLMEDSEPFLFEVGPDWNIGPDRPIDEMLIGLTEITVISSVKKGRQELADGIFDMARAGTLGSVMGYRTGSFSRAYITIWTNRPELASPILNIWAAEFELAVIEWGVVGFDSWLSPRYREAINDR